MGFLTDKCVFSFYTADSLTGSCPIECGNDDLDNYFWKMRFFKKKNCYARTIVLR